MCIRPSGAIISHAPLQQEKHLYSIKTLTAQPKTQTALPLFY